MKDHLEQEEELWQKYWRCCETTETQSIRTARDELVIWYSVGKKSLVHLIAWRMINYLGLNADCLVDLVHDSLLYSGGKKEGLVFAIEQYDPNYGVIFAAFARKHIWYAMLHGETARNSLEPYQIQLAKKFRRLCNEFEAKYHRLPVLLELSTSSGISVQQLKRMEQANWTMDPKSLDEYLEGTGMEEDMERDVADKNALNPEDAIIKKENDRKLEWLSQFLYSLEDSDREMRTELEIIQRAKLGEDELEVLKLRFLYGMDHEQIASRLGMNAGNSRTILSRALEKFRKYLSK